MFPLIPSQMTLHPDATRACHDLAGQEPGNGERMTGAHRAQKTLSALRRDSLNLMRRVDAQLPGYLAGSIWQPRMQNSVWDRR